MTCKRAVVQPLDDRIRGYLSAQCAFSEELSPEPVKALADVLLHLRYTSRSSDALRDKAVAALKKQLTNVTAKPLLRFVSIRHEFPTEWRRFSISQSTSTTPAAVTVDIDVSRFPYFVQGKKIKTESAKVFGRRTVWIS